MNRLKSQLSVITVGRKIEMEKNDNDIVFVSAVRTPLCKSKKGGFNVTNAVDLLTPVLKGVLKVGDKNVDPAIVEDIVVGSVLANGTMRHVESRMASFLAGFPESTSVQTVNRQCSSGLQAIATVASSIRSNYYQIGIAAGVETMTLDGNFKWKGAISDNVYNNKNARNCVLPMGNTSENISERYNLSRKYLDEISLQSHQKAHQARQKFSEEIIPVKTNFKNPKTGELAPVTVIEDDGIRADTTLEALSKLPPAFKKGGSTTAGNSSQVSDGAAAVLMMTRVKAKELKLPVFGTLRSFATKGVPPEVMGVGPVYAIPAALSQASLTIADVDLFEINEAFASQFGFCVDKLGIPWDKVNVNGGAIAIGHPLGCTGARMVVTILHEMRRRKSQVGVVSMCVGTGMGSASVITLG